VFGAMTVLENVLTGLHAAGGPGLAATLLRLPRFRRFEREAVARAREALALVGLTAKAEWRASALAYGDQRRLEIARAAAPQPRLILLDEPAAGMNPAETEALVPVLRDLNGRGTALLLVEHDIRFVMEIADHVTVLNFGRRIADGPPDRIRSDPAVIEAYLGARMAARLASTSA
ncbi:MAG: ABC transporter ATP-binding protein, partial [Acidisphaera sp.]|nr:ABC transporter ATP-binding protein [Acidisphaera sp.]